MSGEWPVDLRGVIESVVTTLGPNDRWNVAALGLHAPEGDGPATAPDDGPVTARTWGRTRTWRNLEERGECYVHFVRDPLLFVEATLGIVERDEPELSGADAVVAVDVERLAEGTEQGTQRVEWALYPVESTVHRRTVPTINRGHNAVVEATVAASRLDVAAYDTDELLDRLAYFESVVGTAGGDREREAFDRLTELVDEEW